jgi:hypothetical protein
MARNLLIAILLAGCTAGVCARHSDCAAGEICSKEGLCVAGGPVSPNDPPACDAGTSCEGSTTSTPETADAAVDAAVDASVDGGE